MVTDAKNAIQFVEMQTEENEPPKMKMHPLYCIGGATYIQLKVLFRFGILIIAICQNRKFVVKSYEFPIFVYTKVRIFHFPKMGNVRWAYGLMK